MVCTLNNISKIYPMPSGQGSLTVLQNITLNLKSNESVAIIGPSGSGKTTLLHIAATLASPSSGEVNIMGIEVSPLSEKQLAGIRNQTLGIVFQQHYLLPQCTLWENVLIPTLAQTQKEIPKEIHKRAHKLLERVGLNHRLEHRPTELSVGECQRAALVRALINRPRILFADEPTGSLDRTSAEELTRLLIELNREENTALMVVTHADHLAQSMDRKLRLYDGRLIALE